MEQNHYNKHKNSAADLIRKKIGNYTDKNLVQKLEQTLDHCLWGYKVKNLESLIKPITIKQQNNDLIVISGIKFTSLCQHHLLPIVGAVDIGYIPQKSITGISGIKRLTEAVTKRLQLQEVICSQICTALHNSLMPYGAITRVVAKHMCTMCQEDIKMHTLHKTGVFLKQDAQVQKFLTMLCING